MNNSSGFIDKIRKDLIFTNVPGETWEELLRSVAARLYAAGVVNEGYADALVKREISYPTGLPIGKFNLALPHTYPQYICEYAVVIAVPSHPVAFRSMEDADETVVVSLLVCPLLEKMDENIKLLPSLMKFLPMSRRSPSWLPPALLRRSTSGSCRAEPEDNRPAE